MFKGRMLVGRAVSTGRGRGAEGGLLGIMLWGVLVRTELIGGELMTG